MLAGVVEVPADDGEQGPLDLAAPYRLRLVVPWDDYDQPKRTKIEAAEEFKLWEG